MTDWDILIIASAFIIYKFLSWKYEKKEVKT
jgi:hypothetical protein